MKKLVSILMIIVLCMSSMTTYAADKEYIKPLNDMTSDELSEFMEKIVYDIWSGNSDKVYKYSGVIKPEAMVNVAAFTSLYKNQKAIGEVLVDYTYPDGASTGDSVIMVNVKAYDSNNFNYIYLLEFHVDEESKIYGFQAWAY